MAEEPHLCPHCGARVEVYDEFCAECGGAYIPPKREKPGPQQKPKPQPRLGHGLKADPKTILVVDDEINTLLVVQRILEKEGYTVDLAATAEQGLSMLRNIQPDLVILDVKMPGISGIEVCRRLRDDPRGRSVKVIFLTVVEYSEEMKTELEKLNISSYITKPFKLRELLRSVREALS